MNPKTHMPLPLESSEELHLPKSEPKPREGPQGKTERKAVGQRNWLDGSLIGETFGWLTVVGKAYRDEKRDLRVNCVCECGQKVSPTTRNVRKGISCLSCGTARRAKLRTIHGESKSNTFVIWALMHQRCGNEKSTGWKNYGGRGIRVCQRWASFSSFLSDMGHRPSKKHSLDRIDNEKDYSPENCKWSTRKEQNRNRRSSKFITAFNETKTLAEWSEKFGVNYGTILSRLKFGWAAELAVTKPPAKVGINYKRSSTSIASNTCQPTTRPVPCSSSGPSGHAP